MSKYGKFLDRYEAGEVPWDHQLPPPEVIALVDTVEPGRGLDLGCGYGRTAIYLAERGWKVDGVDFIPAAVQEARNRLAGKKVSGQAQFHQGSVTEMPYLQEPYDLIIDVGCLHALSDEELRHYGGEIKRLLKPAGQYLLFAHIRDENSEEEEAKGVEENKIRSLFSEFTLEKVDHGTTQVEDKPAWNSAWFWYRKKSDILPSY